MIRDYRDLEVWRLAMDLAEATYRLVRDFPKTEEYRLTSQLLRAAASIPANIAEGNARATRKDYARFIAIARGSLAETETFLSSRAACRSFSRERSIPSWLSPTASAEC